MSDCILTAASLREQFLYDPLTGVFTRRRENHPKFKAGQPAGSIDHYGYRVLSIANVAYKAHRLAWLYVHGEWPVGHLDHRNGIKNDNRLDNLRIAARLGNATNRGKFKNNTSGYKGVSYCKRSLKWSAHVQADKQQRHLGYFSTPEEAYAAYCAAAQQLHGEYFRAS